MKKRHIVASPRTKGIRFQGYIKRLLQQATGMDFVTHSTELADVYPKVDTFGYIFECKNRQDFDPSRIGSQNWLVETLRKVEAEAAGIQKKGIVVAKGNHTGIWAIMSLFTYLEVTWGAGHCWVDVRSPRTRIQNGNIIAIPFDDLLSIFVLKIERKKT